MCQRTGGGVLAKNDSLQKERLRILKIHGNGLKYIAAMKGYYIYIPVEEQEHAPDEEGPPDSLHSVPRNLSQQM
jgi:hypothetical protein